MPTLDLNAPHHPVVIEQFTPPVAVKVTPLSPLPLSVTAPLTW